MATLTPAYGRDYKSKAAVFEDLNAGKDFIFNDITSPWDGKYCSIRDFKEGERHQVRWHHITKVAVFTVKNGKAV
jgi:hypothetical protein